MTGKTHFVSSVLTISSACIVLNNPIHIVLFAAGNFYGSLVPDIDVDNSVGRSTFVLSAKIYDLLQNFFTSVGLGENMFTHRGIMHSLAIPILSFVLAYKNANLLAYALWGLGIGYVMHLFLDFITAGKKGLALLSPITNYRFKFPIYIKTSGIFESIVLHSMEVLSLLIVLFFTGNGLQVISI